MFYKSLLAVSVVTVMANTSFASGSIRVSDEQSLRSAFERASFDSSIDTVVFDRNTRIALSEPAVYSGSQALSIFGNGAVIDGSSAGEFVLDGDLTAITEDGSLVFNTSAALTIRNLSVINSATRGIVVNIPADATGADVAVTLDGVKIRNSALFGLHIDDNADEFDDGLSGSSVGIHLQVLNAIFTENGTGAIDFDGVRVDERGEGDIEAFFYNTSINANGGDGMELDEAGDGDVIASLLNVKLNNNGYYNAEDLDDGFDVDEAGEGDVRLILNNVEINGNLDEGLDVDEAGEGSVELRLRKVTAVDNADEGVKVDEEDEGDIEANLKQLTVRRSGDDGIQFTETGEGKINAKLNKVVVRDSGKFGIKFEQWVEEDEAVSIEPEGRARLKKVRLTGNLSGDEVQVNNVKLK
ncbi:MAG: hypothetical protein ACJASY_000154 [Halioglobus sp.]|jgi:hypothetical protein